MGGTERKRGTVRESGRLGRIQKEREKREH